MYRAQCAEIKKLLAVGISDNSNAGVNSAGVSSSRCLGINDMSSALVATPSPSCETHTTIQDFYANVRVSTVDAFQVRCYN